MDPLPNMLTQTNVLNKVVMRSLFCNKTGLNAATEEEERGLGSRETSRRFGDCKSGAEAASL